MSVYTIEKRCKKLNAFYKGNSYLNEEQGVNACWREYLNDVLRHGHIISIVDEYIDCMRDEGNEDVEEELGYTDEVVLEIVRQTKESSLKDILYQTTKGREFYNWWYDSFTDQVIVRKGTTLTDSDGYYNSLNDIHYYLFETTLISSNDYHYNTYQEL